MKNHKTKRGVTLVEIAIVLVIIGLLLGGVLKGQELINNAKVRSIADRQNSLKVAWFSFIDRYQALAGDYVRAEQNVPGAINGDGNGVIDLTESVIVFQHLTGAGYLRCPQCTATTAEAPTAFDSLQNQYGGVMSIFHDEYYYSATGGPQGQRLAIHTGPLLPSNIISEVDRKLDDGVANTGDLVFNNYDPNPSGLGTGTECLDDPSDTDPTAVLDNAGSALTQTVPTDWRWTGATPPIANNCGASVTI